MGFINEFKLRDNLTCRLMLLASCIFIIAFREIDLLIFPRFWAEEGQLFYPFALHHSLWDIFTTSQVGYLTLFNSIVSALQAKVFSVESAPIISTYLGFFVQLIPVVVVIFTSYLFWNSIFKKFVCAMIIILGTPPEMWLNTTNSHFIFGLITFLIMVVPAVELSKPKQYLFRVLLIIGALTGPASMFLTPIFLLKAYRERSKEKYIQAGILVVCSLIQATVIIHTLLYSNNYQRLQQYNVNLTLSAFFTDNFSLNMNRAVFGITMSVFYIYLFIKNRKSAEHLIFLLSFIIISVFSTLGSLNMQGAPRYSYIPTCIFMFLIATEFFEVKQAQFSVRAVFSSVIFISCLSLSCICYKYRMQYVYKPVLPKWKDEVAKYRSDNNYKPKIHPDYLYVQF